MRVFTLSISLLLLVAALHATQDLSFGIADIKYDGTTLKILELGEGTRSMFAGFDTLHGEGAMWSNIWNFLSIKKPIFFVDEDLNTPAKRRAISYATLIKHGGVACTSLDQLANHPAFIRPNSSNTSSLVIIRHDPADAPEIKKFHLKFPNTIICNAAISSFVNSKKLTDELFTGALRAFRPWAITLPKNEVAKHVDHILASCNAKQFVIKPVAGSKGEGVLFVPRRQLATTLRSITAPHQRRPITRSTNEAQWLNDTETELLIESCESSKPIDVGGELYDATLRVVYGFVNSTATILGCYWKLPSKPLDAQCTLEEKKLSHITQGTQCAAPVSNSDAQAIAAILLPILTDLYEKMLKKELEQ